MNCKAQLVELAGKIDSFRQRGLGIAAISNDSAAALKHFASRRRIPFPLLSDPDSAVIRRLGALNPQADGAALGGTVLVDELGVVRAKFFEENLRERRSAGSILLLEGEPARDANEHRTDHFTLRTAASDREAFPQQRVTLVLDLDLEEGMHAYAPGVKGYRPLSLTMDPHPLVARFHDTQFPASRPYLFKPLNETVPVLAGRFRVTRDLTFAWGKEMHELVRSPSPTVTVTGRLDYQVCSDTVCYTPKGLPLQWTFKILPFDDDRVPPELRRPGS